MPEKKLHLGRWMPAGIGVLAAPGILFGSFNPGSSKGFQVTGFVSGCQLEPAQEGHRIVTGLQESSESISEK